MNYDAIAINRALRRKGFSQEAITDSQRRADERIAARAEQIRQYHANVTQPDGFAVTCGSCNYTGNFDDFVKDRFGFERPENVFQCPKCNLAIRREADGSGFVKLNQIQSTL